MLGILTMETKDSYVSQPTLSSLIYFQPWPPLGIHTDPRRGKQADHRQRTGEKGKRLVLCVSVCVCVCVCVFLGPHPQHMEVPRLGVESELQLLAYTTATATQDPSLLFDLHHNS